MEHNNYASNSDDDEEPGALWDFEDAEVDSPVMFALENEEDLTLDEE